MLGSSSSHFHQQLLPVDQYTSDVSDDDPR